MYARTSLVVGLAGIFLIGCNKTSPPSIPAGSRPTAGTASSTAPHAATAPDATNTALNKRDRDGTTPTADKQSESRSDLQIAARIRREITKDGSLSVNAHNVKIITEGANVTLRGPVDSEQEKSTVVADAQRIAGNAKVVDELEVKQP